MPPFEDMDIKRLGKVGHYHETEGLEHLDRTVYVIEHLEGHTTAAVFHDDNELFHIRSGSVEYLGRQTDHDTLLEDTPDGVGTMLWIALEGDIVREYDERVKDRREGGSLMDYLTVTEEAEYEFRDTYYRDLVDAIDEFGGFLAGFKSWYHDQDAADQPSAAAVIDTLQEEYHEQIERVLIDQQGGD
jgi:hypothetical protein